MDTITRTDHEVRDGVIVNFERLNEASLVDFPRVRDVLNPLHAESVNFFDRLRLAIDSKRGPPFAYFRWEGHRWMRYRECTDAEHEAIDALLADLEHEPGPGRHLFLYWAHWTLR